MKAKRILAYCLTAALAVTSLTWSLAYAGPQEELDKINQQISNTQKKLNEGKKVEKDLMSQIKNLDKQIDAAEKEIASLQKNIGRTEAKVEAAVQNLALVQQEMNQQNESLNQRLRVMYKNGDIGLIEILLGSENLGDFMTNLDMIQKIYDNDVKVLEQIEAQHQKIQIQKQQLEALQNQLLAEKQDEAAKQKTLEVSRGNASYLKAEVAKDNKTLEQQIDELNKEADDLIDEIKKLQGDQAYIGGKFAWPSPGYNRITSPFGYRIHPILKVKKMHTGIDVAVPSGKKIVAVNEGTVIMSGWYGGYGNVVMVDHGGGIVSLYAHNSKLAVGIGASVTKGQTIAYAGSTGQSTGPHLHFEVRVNGKYVNPTTYF